MGRRVAEDMGVSFMGSIPLNPGVASDSDEETPFVVRHPDSPAAKAFQETVEKILKTVKNEGSNIFYGHKSRSRTLVRQNA